MRRITKDQTNSVKKSLNGITVARIQPEPVQSEPQSTLHTFVKERQLVGIDVGGTFTDFVWLVDGRLEVHKAATTPADQSQAIVEGLAALGVAAT